jgi:long-chain acyl-CoA synthetase
MFDRLMDRYATSDRFILHSKIDGSYRGMGYGELRSRVEACACGFAALGIHRGDRVALISENRPEWIISDFALMHLGAINVSVYPTFSQKQIEYIFQHAGVEYAIVSNVLLLKKIMLVRETVSSLKKIIHFFDESCSGKNCVSLSSVMEDGKKFAQDHPAFLSDEKRKTRPDDILTLIYTSGTTGTPKGVILTHRNLVKNIMASADSIPFNEDDNILSFLPLCHSYERMAGYYAAIACGVNIAYAESVDKVFENMVEIRPTVVTTVPRLFEQMYRRIMRRVGGLPLWRRMIFHVSVRAGKRYHRERRQGSVPFWTSLFYAWGDKLVLRKIRERTGGRIRFFVSGGAALSPDLGEFFEAAGILIIEGYGMTEASPVISFNRIDNYKFGTVGIPIPNVEVKISHDSEILVKGPNVMKGYWRDEAATREMIDPDGWLHTGDIGMIDKDGFLIITDRKKHIFVTSGGKNIAPQHIERLFSQHYLIEQFILIGDGRTYLTGIVVPNFEAVREVATEIGLSTVSIAETVRHEKMYRHYEHEMNKIQKDLAGYERVRKFVILDHALTIEEGEITPSLKVKRKIVEERYKDLIDKMYE